MSTNYRVTVHFDPEKAQFVARAPELPHCVAEGATRGEAIAKLDDEIAAQIANIREQGGRVPVAVDQDDGLSGELSVKVSRGLHRELLWQARSEGVEVGSLMAELLAGALEVRKARRGGQPQQQRPQGQGQGNDRRGNERGGQGQGGGRYHNIMEDRASFVEYVRSLEQGGGPGRGPQRRGPQQGRGPQPQGRGPRPTLPVPPDGGNDRGNDDPDDE